MSPGIGTGLKGDDYSAKNADCSQHIQGFEPPSKNFQIDLRDNEPLIKETNFCKKYKNKNKQWMHTCKIFFCNLISPL